MKTIIKCGKLFNPNTKCVEDNRMIIVDGDRVEAIVALGEYSAENTTVIDLSGKFVMPGMIDAHVHSGSNGEGDSTAVRVRQTVGDTALIGLKNVQKDIFAGFTTIRDCGANDFTDVAIRNAINRGDYVGPRMVVAGKSMGSTGGHPDSHYSPDLIERGGKPHIIDGVPSAYFAARYNIKYGADFLKFMATGGVMSYGTTVGAQQLTYDEMAAIIEIANMYGVHTATHAHGTSGIKAAVKAGVTSVEHGMILDDEAIDLMLEKGTYLTPTIIAADSIVVHGHEIGVQPWAIAKAQQVLSTHQAGFRKCLERGVKISFGSDAGTPHNYHGGQAYEFQLLNSFGMKTEDALVAATKTNSELIRRNDQLGTLEPGKYADIIAFEENPMDNVKTLMNCVFVMKGGSVVKG